MSFSIKAIVLYSHDGEKRILRFGPGLNVITGKSKTGKSAIIDIIDYCLGRGSFNVAEGEIRKRVSWFGLHLSNKGDEVFIARDNPGPGASTGSMVYFSRGVIAEYPDVEDIGKNTTETSLKTFVTQFAGILENENRPETGTRPPLEANISHALLLCFQPQGTIASKDQLFHRMNEPFLPQALKDTFPYLIGAVEEDHLRYLYELDEHKRRLRFLEAQEAKKLQAIELSRNRVSRIVNEGKRLGLIPQEYQAVDDTVFSFLSDVAQTQVDGPTLMQDFGETIQRLEGDRRALALRLEELNQDRRAAMAFLSAQTDFSREATEQQSRLRSIGLFKGDSGKEGICPICESSLDAPVPSVEQITESLEKVSSALSFVHRESPHLQSHVTDLEKNIAELTDRLRDVQRELNTAISSDQEAKAAQDQVIARARYLGRLSDFLETLSPDSEDDDVQEQIAELKILIEAVQSKINSEETASRMDTFLNLIGDKMTAYSQELSLEHSGSSLRLDVKKLTVVADTEDGPIPLSRMGSGENWVGYHVLTHLALHWWLRRKARPVPGFLVFDQPTQAYYPSDVKRGALEEIEKDDDRLAVQQLFQLMKKSCGEIERPFQLIVLDHAHLRDKWFEDAIVEEWRGEIALVPHDWPTQ
ncbi:DUF3732 domain-containing protein [Salibaculum halophilum]|uniref:DUF3732 domain-containing protein n=1 Tax=Salibaculum halophilum TaxID=1914408 RepID=UPI000A123146|nr:DUF3732 domain-containing protein [Salibaculum halophilum]